jgi:hypothetical protein
VKSSERQEAHGPSSCTALRPAGSSSACSCRLCSRSHLQEHAAEGVSDSIPRFCQHYHCSRRRLIGWVPGAPPCAAVQQPPVSGRPEGVRGHRFPPRKATGDEPRSAQPAAHSTPHTSHLRPICCQLLRPPPRRSTRNGIQPPRPGPLLPICLDFVAVLRSSKFKMICWYVVVMALAVRQPSHFTRL